LLCFKSDDPVDFFLIDEGQLDKTEESRLRSDRIIDGAALDLHLMHHFAQHNRDLCMTHSLPSRLSYNVAQAIVHQDQAPM
jgi:hypothetical protein